MLPRLGKLPPRHDARTLKLARYLDRSALPVPPDVVEWGGKVQRWGMFANDRAGCCTCAALGHAIQDWTSEAQGAPATLSDEQVLAAYSAVSGYDPRTGANDDGAVELDVLRYARAQGIGGHRIAAYAAVDWRNGWLLRQALYLFGGLYTGCALPLSAQRQGDLWHVDDARLQGGSAPGSWGGHAIWMLGYRPTWLDIVTWGRRQRVTWPWLLAYCDEAYAIVTEDWIARATQRAPVGVDLQGLLADLQAVTR